MIHCPPCSQEDTPAIAPRRSESPNPTEDAPHGCGVPDEAPPPENPHRDGVEDNGEVAFLQPLMCADVEEALSKCQARGDHYSPTWSLTTEYLAPVALPRGMSCSQAFACLYSDHSDFVLQGHIKRGDFDIEIPPWPAKVRA